MGYEIPPRVDTAKRFRNFLNSAALPGSSVAIGIAKFDKLPDPITDSSGWTPSSNSTFQSNVLSASITAPSVKDPYSQLYLAGQALGRSIQVSVAGGLLTIGVAGASVLPFTASVPAVSSTTPHTAAPSTYKEEIEAQHDNPDLFLLWACRDLLDETKYLGRLEALATLIDVAAIALPEALYRAKRDAHVDRPYHLKTVVELLPRPGHSAWPGGHAFAMGAIATLIFEALQGKPGVVTSSLKSALERAARRISNNREGAGLHWADDARDGMKAGASVVHQLLDIATKPTSDPDIKYLATIFKSIP